MGARSLATGDLDWVVAVLANRREPLVKHAPIFWRPAPNAATNHRAFIEFLITQGGAKGYRTDTSALIAAPRGDGWLIDDACVSHERWQDSDSTDLWNALAAGCGGDLARFVCPTYESARGVFARSTGLTLDESWWLMEFEDSSGGEADVEVALPGADAITVGAPPVYAPPGPILFLPAPTDPAQAVPAAIEKAPQLGCAAIVVNQKVNDPALAQLLEESGFRQHCDYYTGTIRPL